MVEPATVGVEAKSSMKVSASKRAGDLRGLISRVWLACLTLALILAAVPGPRVDAGELSAHGASAAGGYVGSLACARCHHEIYDSYSRTDMGRSMSAVNPALLGKIST